MEWLSLPLTKVGGSSPLPPPPPSDTPLLVKYNMTSCGSSYINFSYDLYLSNWIYFEYHLW